MDISREEFVQRLAAVSAALGDPWVPHSASNSARNFGTAVENNRSKHRAKTGKRAAQLPQPVQRVAHRTFSPEACLDYHARVQAVSRTAEDARFLPLPNSTHSPGQTPGLSTPAEQTSTASHYLGSMCFPGQPSSRQFSASGNNQPIQRNSDTPGWQGRVSAEASRIAATDRGNDAGGPRTWGTTMPRDPPLPSTRYVAPPDISAKWGASRLPGVPSRLTLAPHSTALEKLVAERPFLRYTDFLQRELDRQPPVVSSADEAQPVPRPAQLAVRRG